MVFFPQNYYQIEYLFFSVLQSMSINRFSIFMVCFNLYYDYHQKKSAEPDTENDSENEDPTFRESYTDLNIGAGDDDSDEDSEDDDCDDNCNEYSDDNS